MRPGSPIARARSCARTQIRALRLQLRAESNKVAALEASRALARVARAHAHRPDQFTNVHVMLIVVHEKPQTSARAPTGPSSSAESAAATQIQAAFRGHRTRRDLEQVAVRITLL